MPGASPVFGGRVIRMPSSDITAPAGAHLYTAHENTRGNGICRRRGKMVEHQCVDIGGINNFGGLNRCCVIIKRIGQNFGQCINLCRVQCIGNGLNQLRLQNFVD